MLANPADLRTLGCKTEAEALGKRDFDFFPPEVAAKFFADDMEVIQTGQPVLHREEYFLDDEGRKQWLLTSKVPMRDASGSIIGLMGIGRDITSLKVAEEKLEAVHRELVTASRQAGMAEVATGVLHNVGNVLNSVNVSVSLVAQRLRESKTTGVTRLANLLQENAANLAAFLSTDERGRKVPEYLKQLAEHLERERADLRREVESLSRNVEHIKTIVAMQQSYAQVSGVSETVALSELLEDAIKIHAGAFLRHGVTIVREYEAVPKIPVDKHKVLQILVNLLSNAKYACDGGASKAKQVAVRLKPRGDQHVQVQIADNGMGIPPQNLTRIFSQGFTTRRGGHGFGLHSGALAAAELNGSLTAHSDGPGHGATFTLELPLNHSATRAGTPASQTGLNQPDKTAAPN